MSANLLVKNAKYLDVVAGEYRQGDIHVTDGVIQQIGDGQEQADYPRFDASGKYVLPGFIDCHVHVTAATADLAALTEWSPNYVAFGTAKLMGEMLDRGFTTVRDAAGADFGIHDAQTEGLLPPGTVVGVPSGLGQRLAAKEQLGATSRCGSRPTRTAPPRASARLRGRSGRSRRRTSRCPPRAARPSRARPARLV